MTLANSKARYCNACGKETPCTFWHAGQWVCSGCQDGNVDGDWSRTLSSAQVHYLLQVVHTFLEARGHNWQWKMGGRPGGLGAERRLVEQEQGIRQVLRSLPAGVAASIWSLSGAEAATGKNPYRVPPLGKERVPGEEG